MSKREQSPSTTVPCVGKKKGGCDHEHVGKTGPCTHVGCGCTALEKKPKK